MSDPVEWLSNRLNEVESRSRQIRFQQQDYSNLRCPNNCKPGYIEGYEQTTLGRRKKVTTLVPCGCEVSPDFLFKPMPPDPEVELVLRLVAATRRLLELHKPTPQGGWRSCCERCLLDLDAVLLESWPCDSVIELAKGWGWTE